MEVEEFVAKHSDVVLSSSIHVLADEIEVSSLILVNILKNRVPFLLNLAQQNSQSIDEQIDKDDSG